MKLMKLITESIGFQNDNFGSLLEAGFYTIQEHIKETPTISRKEINKLDFARPIEDVIFKRLGLRIKFNFDTTCIGAIMVFPINKNHVLLPDHVKGYEEKNQDKLIKEFKNKEGYVDLASAKVSGIFSEYVHTLCIDVINAFQSGFTVPEVVAIIMHELGHAFTYYELSDRLSSTNQILADLSLTVKSDGDKSKRTYLFKELSDKLEIDSKSFDDLINEDSRVIFGTKLYKRYLDGVSSLMDNKKYDNTSSEQVADNFAARFGYGRELIIALDKFYKNAPEKNNFTYYLLSSADFLYFIVYRSALIIFFIVGGMIPLAILITMFYGTVIYFFGDNFRDMTYDELKIRYVRIRHQYIEKISSLNLDKSELSILVSNLNDMDNIIKNTKIYDSFFNKISNYVFSINGSVREDLLFQQMLEEITHNELFVKSAELKLLS